MARSDRPFRLASLLAAALTLALAPSPARAAGSSPISSHQITARLEPATHRLEATDRLSLQGLPAGATLPLLLHKDLAVKAVKSEPSGAALSFTTREGPGHRQVVAVSLGGAFNAPSAVSIAYEGHIYDPVRKAETLAFVRGDETTGLIGPEGVFLDASSGWYPDSPEEGMAAFNAEVSVPEPFMVVTQGRLDERLKERGREVSRWKSEAPADGLVLVAGPYRASSRREGPVTISTYFLSGSEELAQKYLDAAAGYIAFYGELLGPYPYSKFDIVENFFSSGYGMPGFTLLGPGVVAQGERALRPGYLDHEIVHSWWGNYVFHRPGPGNWAEGLTTYCANYYWREAKEGPEAARDWRRRTVQKYAIRVKADKEYAVSEFSGKVEDFENDIGYGKASMVFHMLRKQMGDDNFWGALREVVKRFGGRHAAWADFQRVFEATSGQDLRWFFDQWLTRKGGPALALRDVSVRPAPGGFHVEGRLVQEGESYRLPVALRLEAGRGTQEVTVELAGPSSPVSFETESLPRAVVLDPEGQLFRKLSASEVVPGLNALLEDSPAVVVVPDQGQDPDWKVYRELAERASAQKGVKVLSPGEASDEVLRGSSVLLFGRVRNMARFKDLAGGLPGWIGMEEASIHVKGDKYEDPADAALLVGRNPLNPDHFAGFYFGLSEKALGRSRLLYFYGWDSYVVFRGGRPLARGDVEALHSPARYSAALALARPIARGALMEHVRLLADSSLRGRFPGTIGDRRAAGYVQEQLERAGFEPVVDTGKNRSWTQPFTLVLPDIGFFHVSLARGGGESQEPDAWPVVGSPEGRYESEVVEAGFGLATPERDDYRGKSVYGKAVLVQDGLPEGSVEPEGGALEVLEKKIEAAAEKGASALLVAISGPMPDAYLAISSYPSIPSPALKAKLAKHGGRGGYTSLPMEIMKLQSRNELMEPPALPVVLVPEAERWRLALDSSGSAPLELRLNLHYKRLRWKTHNVVGYVLGSDPLLRRDIVVIGAHYDALGPSPRGDIYLGADDNASGVAALIEASKLLARQRGWLKRSLLVVAFGAEEWGMVGSRYYLEHPARDLARTTALLNADAIAGRTPAALAYLIGRSHYPALASKAEAYLPELGLAAGPDIDQHAFRYGSDHWPFHKAGIPVIDFWASDYRRMNTAEDTIENLDEDKLERMARLLYLTALDLLTAPETPAHAPSEAR